MKYATQDFALVPTITQRTTTWKQIREAMIGGFFIILFLYMAFGMMYMFS